MRVNKIIPGEEHISDAQAQQIKKLVAEIVKLEKHVKDKPRSYGAVWSTFQNKFECTSYKLLKEELFEQAISYLRQTIGRLDKASNATDAPDWRSRKYKYIHTNSKSMNLS